MSIIYNYSDEPFTVITDDDIISFEDWMSMLDYIALHDPILYNKLAA